MKLVNKIRRFHMLTKVIKRVASIDYTGSDACFDAMVKAQEKRQQLKREMMGWLYESRDTYGPRKTQLNTALRLMLNRQMIDLTTALLLTNRGSLC